MKMAYLAAAIVAALTACGVPAEKQNANQSSPDQVLSADDRTFLPEVGTHSSRTMLVGMPRKGVEILNRMAAAVQQRPAWIADWSKNHRDPDGTLQYHPNLGISEEEHRLIGQMTKNMSLQEVERGKLTVAQRSDGGLEISSAGRAAYLNGIVIHADKNFVETRHGRLTKLTEINQSDQNSPTGVWRGVQWSDDNGGLGPVTKLAIGKRPSGEMIIYYDVEPSDDETLVLLYKQGI